MGTSPRAGFGNTGRTGSTTAPAAPAAPAAPTSTTNSSGNTNGYQVGGGPAFNPTGTGSDNWGNTGYTPTSAAQTGAANSLTTGLGGGIKPFTSTQTNGQIADGMSKPDYQTPVSSVNSYNTSQFNSPTYASTYGDPSNTGGRTGIGNGADLQPDISAFNSSQTNGQIAAGLPNVSAAGRAGVSSLAAYNNAQLSDPNYAATYGLPDTHDPSRTGIGTLSAPGPLRGSALGVAPSPTVAAGRAGGLNTPAAAAPGTQGDPTLSWNVYDQSTHTGTPTPEQFAAYSQRVQAQMAASNASALQQQMSQYGVTGDNYWTHPSNIPMPGYLLAQLSPQQQAQYSGAPAQSFQPDPAINQAIYANRVSQLYGSPAGGMTQSGLSNPYGQFGASQPQNPNYGNNQLMMLLNLLSALGLGSSQNQFGNGYNPMFSGSYGNLLGNNTRYY